MYSLLLPHGLFRLGSFVATAIVLLSPPAHGQSTYTITDLGPNQAQDINNTGQILVGNSIYQNGVFTTVPSYTNPNVTNPVPFTGFSINDAGQAVGSSTFRVEAVAPNPSYPDGIPQHFDVHILLYSGGVTTDTNASDLLGNVSLTGRRINNSGNIVGFGSVHGPGAVLSGAEVAFSSVSGYLWLPNTDTLTATGSSAWGVNNAGTVVGQTTFNNTVSNTYATMSAFSYNGGTYTNIAAQLTGWNWSAADVVNNSNVIAGHGSNGMFVYSGGTVFSPGSVVPMDINDAGLVVGYSSADGHAYSYLTGGTLVDLNTVIPGDSGWILRAALGVNDAGQIVGGGYINGEYHGFLLTPTAIPEPSTFAVWLGAAVLGAALCRRRNSLPASP